MRRPPRTAVAVVLRIAAVVTTLLAGPVVLVGTAAADVTVAASRAYPAARDVLITFRVTNPDPAVPTTRLQVFLPTVRPLRGVRPAAPNGWTARVAPGGAVATSVTWEGGPLAGAGTGVFPLDVDRLPEGAGPLRFHVVQTFASGAVEEWSDLVPPGVPAPAHPDLEIAYGPAPGDPAPVAPVDAAPVGHHHGDGPVTLPDDTGSGGVWAFLAVAGAGGTAVVTAAGALGRRQERALSRRGRRP